MFADNRLVNYIRASYAEMKKVTWPTRQETIKLTVAVIFISLFVAAFLGVLDFIFSQIIERLILGGF